MQLRINNNVSLSSSRRRTCCQAVQRPSAAVSPTTAAPAADQAQQAASGKAVAGLAAAILAASALSPVAAWADEACVGPFCSGTPGSMVAAAQDFTGEQVQCCYDLFTQYILCHTPFSCNTKQFVPQCKQLQLPSASKLLASCRTQSCQVPCMSTFIGTCRTAAAVQPHIDPF